MGRRHKPPVQINLHIRFVPASEQDARDAVSALARMYRHVMLRNPRILAALRRMDSAPAQRL